MSRSLLLSLCLLAAAGCGDDPVPPEPGPPTFPDRTVIPVDAVPDLPPAPDVTIDRQAPCRTGGFRPCECMAAMQGREFCVNGAYEGMCRCDDSGPPPSDATPMVDDQFEPMEDLPPITDVRDGGATMDGPRG